MADKKKATKKSKWFLIDQYSEMSWGPFDSAQAAEDFIREDSLDTHCEYYIAKAALLLTPKKQVLIFDRQEV